MSEKKVEQVQAAERLQNLWLEKMEERLNEGSVTSTDLATILRFLEHNGWSVDPKDMPKNLRDMLSSDVSFDDDPEADDPPLRIAR